MRVKLFTFRYSATLGGFDDTALGDFVRDKKVGDTRQTSNCGILVLRFGSQDREHALAVVESLLPCLHRNPLERRLWDRSER